jgi:peptidoglycan hydrolase-like protein with peptidoglycan-binding domain
MARKPRTKKYRWQYGKGEYLSTASVNRNAVSSGPAVNALRRSLGLPAGSYDADTRRAVIEAQEAGGLPVTGVVAETDWDVIVNELPAPAPSSVDGADEGDPAAVLDPPEGS